MVTQADLSLVVQALQSLPPPPDLPELKYAHLSQCVLSAVFSINTRAEAERLVASRYIVWRGLAPAYRPDRQVFLDASLQEPISHFVQAGRTVGSERLAVEVLRNRQWTSTTVASSISKAEASLQFAEVLVAYGIENFQDLAGLQQSKEFAEAIMRITGQGSGITYDYFFMLAGDENAVKIDRHVYSFLEQAVGHTLTNEEMKALTRVAAAQLGLTPREVDNQIWEYRRLYK
jgi:hypothetical protein